MWLKINLCFVIIFGAETVGTVRASLDMNRVERALDSTMTCLEKFEKLSMNASYALAYGLTEMPYIIETVPNLTRNTKETIAIFQTRMMQLFIRSIAYFPDLIDVQVVWYPEFWHFTGDYHFKTGRIPEQDKSKDSLSEIFERSVYSGAGKDCYIDMIAKNLKSSTFRNCELPCEAEVYDRNFNVGMSSEQRWLIIGTQRLLNCSNHNPDIVPYWIPICTYQKQQLDRLYDLRKEDQFVGLRYHFLNKITQCGAAGFPEFLTEDLMTYILDIIEYDGCIRKPGDSEEDVQVLTALAAAAFSQAVRLVHEHKNGLPRVL